MMIMNDYKKTNASTVIDGMKADIASCDDCPFYGRDKLCRYPGQNSRATVRDCKGIDKACPIKTKNDNPVPSVTISERFALLLKGCTLMIIVPHKNYDDENDTSASAILFFRLDRFGRLLHRYEGDAEDMWNEGDGTNHAKQELLFMKNQCITVSE